MHFDLHHGLVCLSILFFVLLLPSLPRSGGGVSIYEACPSDPPRKGINMQETNRPVGKIESKRRRGQQRGGRLAGITDSMDVNLGKLWETVRDREAWRAAGSPRGHKESDTTERLTNKPVDPDHTPPGVRPPVSPPSRSLRGKCRSSAHPTQGNFRNVPGVPCWGAGMLTGQSTGVTLCSPRGHFSPPLLLGTVSPLCPSPLPHTPDCAGGWSSKQGSVPWLPSAFSSCAF